jgi:transposase, IS5 family
LDTIIRFERGAAAELAVVLPSEPGEVYSDSASNGSRSAEAIQAKGGRAAIVATGTWGRPAALTRLEAHNVRVRRVRCRIEKVFGTCKRNYGLRRMRWIGLAKAGLQVRLAAVAYNLQRTLTLVQPAAT